MIYEQLDLGMASQALRDAVMRAINPVRFSVSQGVCGLCHQMSSGDSVVVMPVDGSGVIYDCTALRYSKPPMPWRAVPIDLKRRDEWAKTLAEDTDLYDTTPFWRLGGSIVMLLDERPWDLLVRGRWTIGNAVAQAVAEAESEGDSWRMWQHNRPGECPCGIARAQCEYHGKG